MKFAYWSREITGWILILIGLYAFMRAYDLLLNKRIFESAQSSSSGLLSFGVERTFSRSRWRLRPR